MKKVLVVIVMISCVVGSVFINLYYNKTNDNNIINSDKLEFADIVWTRSGDSDTEFIEFNSNGTYSYYCACGNPINDSDLCENYTYNEDSKTISLHCTDKTSEMITEIKVVSYDSDSLVLNFDGEIREFDRDLNE